jgi:hypothetical protein
VASLGERRRTKRKRRAKKRKGAGTGYKTLGEGEDDVHLAALGRGDHGPSPQLLLHELDLQRRSFIDNEVIKKK